MYGQWKLYKHSTTILLIFWHHTAPLLLLSAHHNGFKCSQVGINDNTAGRLDSYSMKHFEIRKVSHFSSSIIVHASENSLWFVHMNCMQLYDIQGNRCIFIRVKKWSIDNSLNLKQQEYKRNVHLRSYNLEENMRIVSMDKIYII